MDVFVVFYLQHCIQTISVQDGAVVVGRTATADGFKWVGVVLRPHIKNFLPFRAGLNGQLSICDNVGHKSKCVRAATFIKIALRIVNNRPES